MRRQRRKTLLICLLGIASAGLAWVIYEEVVGLSRSDEISPADVAAIGDPDPDPAPAILSMPDKEAFSVILQRPLFSQTRRAGEAATDGAGGTSIDFTLSGVVISGNESSALVRTGPGETVQQLKVGENIGGWTLVEVASDRVIIRRDQVEAEVFLDYAAPAPPVPRTQTPPAELNSEPTAGNEDERQMNETAAPEAETSKAPKN